MVTNIIGFKIYFFTIDVILLKEAKRHLTVSFQVLVFFCVPSFVCVLVALAGIFGYFLSVMQMISAQKKKTHKKN